MNCKYCDDYTGICAKPECPMCGDCCPVPDVEGVCKFEDREEFYQLSPKSCGISALMTSGLISDMNDPMAEKFWKDFFGLMIRYGYAPKEDEYGN